jgi:hypothetical protein
VDLDLIFPTATAAEKFCLDWLADEEPGCSFEVLPTCNGRKYTVLLREPDGYLINREPPRVSLSGSVAAPGKQAWPHLG